MRRILFALIVVLCFSSLAFAPMWLRQSTAVTVKVGPFLDSTDGVTPESGLDIDAADVRLSKNGGDIAAKTDANNNAAYDEVGMYDIKLDATDTGTLGRLQLIIIEAGACPVWQDFMVVPANVWDSMFGSDYLQVDNAQWLGETIAAVDTAGYPKVTIKDGTGTGELDTASGKVLTSTCDTLTTYTGNTPQTGDSYARLGAPVGASISADIAALPTDADVTAAVPTAAANAAATAVLLDPNLTLTMGYALAAKTAAEKYDTDAEYAAAIWNAATESYGSAGSYGLLVETNLDATISSRGTSTLTASDNIGINWADVSNPTTTLVLSGTTVGTLTTYTGNTLQTGDSYAIVNNGTYGLSALNTDIDAILADTGELQTDWTDGGRLDLILDGIDIGGAATPAEIRAEIDANSTQLAAILADTSELQTDWTDGGRLDLILDGIDIGSAATPAEIRAEIDANSTQLAAILADSNELQTDWHNGGRLDLMLDVVQSLLNDIKRNTASGR